MRSSIQDPSPLFLMPASQVHSDSEGDYILQATDAGRVLQRAFPVFFELGHVPRSCPGNRLAAAVSRAITVEESAFFANKRALAALISHALPALIPSRRYCQTLRIWSAGCATGQETYSLAIALAECLSGIGKTGTLKSSPPRRTPQPWPAPRAEFTRRTRCRRVAD